MDLTNPQITYLMQITDYLSELVYAAVGTLLGYLLMKMDDMLNNKQYTHKEYSKFALGCYLATLSGLLLMRFVGPMRLPGSDKSGDLIRPIPSTIGQIGGAGNSGQIPLKAPAIPSGGTAFFQPASGGNTLRFTAGTPTF